MAHPRTLRRQTLMFVALRQLVLAYDFRGGIVPTPERLAGTYGNCVPCLLNPPPTARGRHRFLPGSSSPMLSA